MTTTNEQAMWADALAMAIPIGGLTVEQRHSDLIALADRIIAAGVFSISLGRPDALSSTPEASDDYEAGYNEGFHHGRSTPRVEASDDGKNALKSIVIRAHDDSWTDGDEHFHSPTFVTDAVWAAGYRRGPVPADTPSEDEREALNRIEVVLNRARDAGVVTFEAGDLGLVKVRDLRLALDRTSRPTPPEDVERVADLIRDGILEEG